MYIFLAIIILLVILEFVALIIRSRMHWTEGIFKSDGCTCVPEGNWTECCESHDEAYRSGGWMIKRFIADCKLCRCIGKNGNWFAAIIYFVGVRVFGMWSFRYGKHIDLKFE